MRNAIFALLLAISLASAFNVSDCTGAGGGYSIINISSASVNNGALTVSSTNFVSLVTVGSPYGETSGPTMQTSLGPLAVTPPYVIQFDFLNIAGTTLDINYTVGDLDGIHLINQTSISSTSGSCTPTSTTLSNQTYNIEYHCTGIASNSSITIDATNNYGLTTSTTRSLTTSNAAFHCFYGLAPTNLGTATLTVLYNTSGGDSVGVSLNGHPLGNLSGSGHDVFVGIPLAWLNNTSIANYVSTNPAANTSISSSAISYYSGMVPYSNYSVNHPSGVIIVNDTGSYDVTYSHASSSDQLIMAMSDFWPLLIAVGLLLLIWRVGVYWEKSGN